MATYPIDCYNKPDTVVADVRGQGRITTIQLREDISRKLSTSNLGLNANRNSFPDFSSDYLEQTAFFLDSNLNKRIPAIYRYGVEATVEALTLAYDTLLSENNRRAYDNIVLSTGVESSQIALDILIATQNAGGQLNTTPLNATQIALAPNSSIFFENQFSGINDRFAQGVITPIELAEFADEYSYTDMEQIQEQIRNDPFNFLNLLNAFFLGSMALAIAGGVCNVLSNPFAALSGILESATDLIQKAQEAVATAKAILSGGIGGLLSGLQGLIDDALGEITEAFNKINAFKDTIKNMIENVVDQVKQKFENVVNKFQSFAENIRNGNLLRNIRSMIQDRVTQVRNFFSDFNMERLIQQSQDLIGRFAGQFKEMTLDIAGNILLAGCKMVDFLQDFLSAPVDTLQNLFDKAETEMEQLRVGSDQRTQEAARAGRPVATREARTAARDDFIEEWRGSVLDGVENSGYVEENGEIIFVPSLSSHPDPNSWDHLTFGGQVLNPVQAGEQFWTSMNIEVNMVDYGGGTVIPGETGIDPAIGYYGVQLDVLERANALVESLLELGADRLDGAPSSITGQGKLLITSAFRHRIYNQYLRNTGVGAAVNSQHTEGKALDCIMGRGAFRERFIELAPAHGFKGIGRYNTFVHIDTRSYVARWGS